MKDNKRGVEGASKKTNDLERGTYVRNIRQLQLGKITVNKKREKRSERGDEV